MVTQPLTPSPVMSAAATLHIPACASDVFAVVGDLARSNEWSPECRGGRWISGEPGAVGSIFEGDNYRDADIVAWAPVVRGRWQTRCVVTAAEPDERFAWAMLDSRGNPQASIWSFELEEHSGTTQLIHRFVMDQPTEGITEITSGMSSELRTKFLRQWEEKIAADLEHSLIRISSGLGQ